MLNPQINNPFQPYKDIHLNGTAVLFGSGPSLLQFDASRVPADVLRFGVNDQIFLDLDLDYWFMGDSVPQVPDKFWNRYRHVNDYLPKSVSRGIDCYLLTLKTPSTMYRTVEETRITASLKRI